MSTPLIVNPQYPPESNPFAIIAQTFRPRLASYCGIDMAFVYPVANDDYALSVQEPFFLYYQFFGIDAFGNSGGGRLNPWATRRLRVYIYTRCGVDSYSTDEAALQGRYTNPPNNTGNAPLGQFAAEELVMGALFNWMPKSASNTALCLEPVHPASGSGPAIRKAENEAGLLRSNLDFEVKFGLWIDARDPAV